MVLGTNHQQFRHLAFVTGRSEEKGKYPERQGTNVPWSRRMLKGLPGVVHYKWIALFCVALYAVDDCKWISIQFITEMSKVNKGLFS